LGPPACRQCLLLRRLLLRRRLLLLLLVRLMVCKWLPLGLLWGDWLWCSPPLGR
jgi:hypothetical protein